MQRIIKKVVDFCDLCLQTIAGCATYDVMKINQYLDQTKQSASKYAKKCGIRTSTLTRIMNGEVRQPRFSTQRKIIHNSNHMISYGDLFVIEDD